MQFLQFFTCISFFFVEISRATSKGLAGHFWPAGHRLGTPALMAVETVAYACVMM